MPSSRQVKNHPVESSARSKVWKFSYVKSQQIDKSVDQEMYLKIYCCYIMWELNLGFKTHSNVSCSPRTQHEYSYRKTIMQFLQTVILCCCMKADYFCCGKCPSTNTCLRFKFKLTTLFSDTQRIDVWIITVVTLFDYRLRNYILPRLWVWFDVAWVPFGILQGIPR